MPRHGVCVWVAQEAKKRLSNCFGSIRPKLSLLRRLIGSLRWCWRRRILPRRSMPHRFNSNGSINFSSQATIRPLSKASTATPVWTSPSEKAALISMFPRRLPTARRISGSAAPAFCATGERAAGWSCWPPYFSVPRPSSWSRVGQTSPAWRICVAERSWIRREATTSPRC